MQVDFLSNVQRYLIYKKLVYGNERLRYQQCLTIDMIYKVINFPVVNPSALFSHCEVGIIIFIIGLLAIIKEHLPSVMIFSVAIIFYLLLFMYSRVLTSAGLIILRTLVLLMLSIESLCFAIMVRDWRELQRSRTAKYMTAVANQQFYGNPYGQQIYGYQYYASVPLQSSGNVWSLLTSFNLDESSILLNDNMT